MTFKARLQSLCRENRGMQDEAQVPKKRPCYQNKSCYWWQMRPRFVLVMSAVLIGELPIWRTLKSLNCLNQITATLGSLCFVCHFRFGPLLGTTGKWFERCTNLHLEPLSKQQKREMKWTNQDPLPAVTNVSDAEEGKIGKAMVWSRRGQNLPLRRAARLLSPASLSLSQSEQILPNRLISSPRNLNCLLTGKSRERHGDRVTENAQLAHSVNWLTHL